MERSRGQIVAFWVDTIERAILLGDAEAAYRLTCALVVRCRELGLTV